MEERLEKFMRGKERGGFVRNKGQMVVAGGHQGDVGVQGTDTV
jgi:hypothetical protein